MAPLDSKTLQTSVPLNDCDRELIHIPGSTQPQGFLVALNQHDVIIRISANFAEFLKMDLKKIIGAPLGSLGEHFESLAKSDLSLRNQIEMGGQSFTVQATASGSEKVIEFESELSSGPPIKVLELFQEFVSKITESDTYESLIQRTPVLIKMLTGYDRVMVYKFDSNWHGSVISESKESFLEPFLGLHYPATDIPVQARALYGKKMSRMISDVNNEPVDLISQPHLGPLDLTYSNLRSISPVHIQYLKNMGVRATYVISLIVRERLWGLIACHHYSDLRYLNLNTRKICESTASVISFAIMSFEEVSWRHHQINSNAVIESFLAKLKGLRSFRLALERNEREILSLTEATGICLIENQEVYSFGVCPSRAKLLKLGQQIFQRLSNQNLYQTHQLSRDYPEFQDINAQASGLIAMRLPPIFSVHLGDSLLMWMRPEEVSTVNWAGNPQGSLSDKSSGLSLSPRTSFSKWTEVKKDQSVLWSPEVVAAADNFRQNYIDLALDEMRLLRHQSELSLAHLERLSSIGALTAGIAHDFNNVLLGIQGGAQLIQSAADMEKVRSSCERIKIFCDRGATLIKGLMKHSRASKEDYKPSDAKLILKELSIFIKTMAGMNVLFDFKDLTPPEVICFNGNSTEILQSLLNLINNAKDSILAANGLVEITLKVNDSNGGETTGGSIVFEVKDNGKGIPKESLGRILDPFYSTKETGKGTGLGLASVNQIVSNHGGTLTVTSEIGVGSVFTVTLPRTVVNKPEILPPVEIKQASSGTSAILKNLKLLYVEDDPDNMSICQELFEPYFKLFKGAESGTQALQIFSSEPFDLVISDLRMPGMDGMSFYRKLREIRSETPFILVTGELLSRKQILGHLEDPLFEMSGKPFEVATVLDQCVRLWKTKGSASPQSQK